MENEPKKITRYGAYAVIIQESQLLLTQKKSGPYKGLWGLPGGAIEFGESPEEALKQEIQEETALAVKHTELLKVMTNSNNYFDNEEAYQFHHIGIIYRIKGISILPNIVAEEKRRWIAIREIISDELTPFAKQGFLNGLYTQNG